MVQGSLKNFLIFFLFHKKKKNCFIKFQTKKGQINDFYLVVGSDVFLDGGKGGSLGALQGLDGSHNHGGGWGMGRLGLWLCSLFGGLCGGFRHFEIKKWRC